MIETLSAPELPPAPSVHEPWRAAARDLLEAWRAADPERLGSALDRVSWHGTCGDEGDRLELIEGIGEEMRRALVRRSRRPTCALEGSEVWELLLAHLMFAPVKCT